MTQRMASGHQMELPMESHVTVVDVGSGMMKMVVGEVLEKKLVSILSATSVETRGLHNGAVYNVQAVVQGLRELVEDTHSICGITPQVVAVTFSDPNVAMHSNDAMVAVDQEIIEPRHVREVLSIAARAFPGRREKHILHVVPQRYTVDLEGTTLNPVGLHGVRLDVDSMIVTVPPRPVELLRRAFKEAGLHIHKFFYGPFAAMNAVLTPRERKLGALLIDMGKSTTDVLYVQNEVVRYVVTYPAGGSLLTSDIAGILQCLPEEAEELKLNHAAASPVFLDDPNRVIELDGYETTAGKVSAIVEARLREILGTVREDLAKAGVELPRNATVVLTGGTSHLKGIDAMAGEIFGHKARTGIPDVPGSAFPNIKTPAFSSALGLLTYAASQVVPRMEPSTPPPPPPQKKERRMGFFDSRKLKAMLVE